MKPRKYRNVPTEVDGIRFDSKREAKRYGELKLLEKQGAIQGLVLQPSFEIVVNEKRIGKYTADFRYQSYNSVVVEDVKSPASKTQVYRLRKKLVEALYPVSIVEV